MSSYCKCETLQSMADEYRDLLKQTVRDLNDSHRRSREELQSFLQNKHRNETSDLYDKINSLERQIFRMELEQKTQAHGLFQARDKHSIFVTKKDSVQFNISGGVQYFCSCNTDHSVHEVPNMTTESNKLKCATLTEIPPNSSEMTWKVRQSSQSVLPREGVTKTDVENFCRQIENQINNEKTAFQPTPQVKYNRPTAQPIIQVDNEMELNQIKSNKDAEIIKEMIAYEVEVRERKQAEIEALATKEAESMREDILAKQLRRIEEEERIIQTEIARENVAKEKFDIETKVREDLESDIRQRVVTNKSLRQKYKNRFKAQVREEVLADVQREADWVMVKASMRSEHKHKILQEVRKELEGERPIMQMKMKEELKEQIKEKLMENEMEMKKELIFMNKSEEEIQEELKLMELELRKENEEEIRNKIKQENEAKENEMRKKEAKLHVAMENEYKEKEVALRHDMIAKLRNDTLLREEVEENLRNEIKNDILRSRLEAIKSSVVIEIEDEIRQEMRFDIRNDEVVLERLRKESEEFVQSEMATDWRQKHAIDEEALLANHRARLAEGITVEEEKALMEEVRQDLRDKLKDEVDSYEEMTHAIKTEIVNKMKKSKEEEVRRELETDYKARYEAETMQNIEKEVKESKARRIQELEKSVQTEISQKRQELRQESEKQLMQTIERELEEEKFEMKQDMRKEKEQQLLDEIEKEYEKQKTIRMKELDEKINEEIKEVEKKMFDEKSSLKEAQVDEEIRQLMAEYKEYKDQELEEWKEHYERGRLNDIQKHVDEYLTELETDRKEKGEEIVNMKVDEYLKTYEDMRRMQAQAAINVKYDFIKREDVCVPKECKQADNDNPAFRKEYYGRDISEDGDVTCEDIESLLLSDEDSSNKAKQEANINDDFYDFQRTNSQENKSNTHDLKGGYHFLRSTNPLFDTKDQVCRQGVDTEPDVVSDVVPQINPLDKHVLGGAGVRADRNTLGALSLPPWSALGPSNRAVVPLAPLPLETNRAVVPLAPLPLGPPNRAVVPLAPLPLEKNKTKKKKKKRDKEKEKTASQALYMKALPALKGMVPRDDAVSTAVKTNVLLSPLLTNVKKQPTH